MKKRMFSFFLCFVLCFAAITPAFAAETSAAGVPVNAPACGPRGALIEEETTVSYDEDGNKITSTVRAYGRPGRSGDFEMTVYNEKTIDLSGVGSILTIYLDADFTYGGNSSTCTRYYSSYDVLMPDRIASNSANGYQTDFETGMKQTYPSRACKIQTSYKVAVLNHSRGTLYPTMYIQVDSRGNIKKG